jgi:hypothetical protein
MTTEQKEWIDNATYEELLRRWRYAPVGDPIFQGDTGKYYGEKLKLRREAVGPQAHTQASKNIGWD